MLAMWAKSMALRSGVTARRMMCSVRATKEDSPPKPAKVAAPKPAKAVEKPKALRAPSAYNLFFKSAFHEVKATSPDPKLATVASLLHTKWASLSPEAKAPFEKEAAELKAVVDAKKAVILAEKKANSRPLTGFMLFSNKKRAEVRAQDPSMKMPQVAQALGKMWKGMSGEEQQVYKDESKAQTEAWKAKQA